MRRLVTIIFLALLLAPLYGQYRYNHPDIFYYPSIEPGTERVDNGYGEDSPWLRYSLETGMSFTSVSGYNIMTSFISPKAFIPVGAKFIAEVGTTFISSRLPGEDGSSGAVNSMLVYARGIFAVNERTTLYGEVARSLYTDNPLFKNGFERYTFGMDYFVTPHFRIGASITTVNGVDPRYLYSPYGSQSRFGSPLYW